MRNKKRRGRPSKIGVQRYPSGQPVHSVRVQRGETEVQIMATALAYRQKFVPVKDARQPEAGYELGRMYLAGHLTAQEHRAGFEFARLVYDYQTSQGYPSPFPASMDIGAVHGLSLCSDPDDAKVRRTANEYMRVQTALCDAGRAATTEVREVCIFDQQVRNVDNLRLGLKALARFYQIPVDTQAR